MSEENVKRLPRGGWTRPGLHYGSNIKFCSFDLSRRTVKSSVTGTFAYSVHLITVAGPSISSSKSLIFNQKLSFAMGIKGLLCLLKAAEIESHISEFRGCTLGLDVSCLLYKGAYSCAEKLCLGVQTNE